MTFLAKLSHFNLTNALNRFIPKAGAATGQMIVCFYLISSAAAIVSSLIFLLFIETWTPELGFLSSSPYSFLAFALAVMTWTIYSLQDSVFVGLRQATWIPIENSAFALMKIAMLVGFASLLPEVGILASWSISAALLVLPVNILIFTRLVPRHVHSTEGTSGAGYSVSDRQVRGR